jgi:hypothetical protein
MTKGGDDGVEGDASRRIDVGRLLIEREQRAAVVEHEAEPIGDQAGAEVRIIRLDQRHHHAVLVGDGQIGRIAFDELGFTGTDTGIGAVHADLRAPLFGVFGGDQRLDRNLAERWIAVIFGEIFIGQPLGFDHQMQRVGRAGPHLLQIVAFENFQHLEHRAALTVRRQLVTS